MGRNARNADSFNFLHAHCARCLATNFEWKELARDCTLITFTKVDAVPAAFQEQAPYILGLAEFAEGPKVFAWFDKRLSEDNLTVGMKLKLRVSKLPNGNFSYAFARSDEN